MGSMRSSRRWGGSSVVCYENGLTISVVVVGVPPLRRGPPRRRPRADAFILFIAIHRDPPAIRALRSPV